MFFNWDFSVLLVRGVLVLLFKGDVSVGFVKDVLNFLFKIKLVFFLVDDNNISIVVLKVDLIKCFC